MPDAQTTPGAPPLPRLSKPQLARLVQIGRDRFATHHFMRRTTDFLVRLGLIEMHAMRLRPTPLGIRILAGLPGPEFDRFRAAAEDRP